MAHQPKYSSKERVLRNYSFLSVDRFSIDWCACKEIYDRLKQHYGLKTDLELMEKLHVDFRYPKPNWIGPAMVDDQGRPTDYFCIPRAGIGDFGYAVEHPLANVSSLAEVEAYPWPTVEMWDYDDYTERCRSFEDYAVLGGGWGWFFEAACELVGMQRWFYLLFRRPDLCHAILGKIVHFMEGYSDIMFQKAGKYIDICFTGDDYGIQSGPMISQAMFNEYIRPYLQRMYNVGIKYGKPVMHHSCGSVAKFIPTFMEMGLNILEPIQVGAAGMDIKELSGKYGGKLCFHGSINTQQTLPFGTPEDVRREVCERVETFKSYGGFTISPSQHLLPEIPTENIVAMYEAAWEFSWL
jgi:uroporphyrinogen decarboxylase